MLYIKIFGAGCPTCHKLEQMCREIISENNIEASIEKITDRVKFLDYGIAITPAIIINGKLLCSGKLPVKHTLEKWMRDMNESEFIVDEQNLEE